MLVSLGHHAKAQGDLVDLLLECHDKIRSFVRLAEAVGTRVDLKDGECADACARVTRYFREALPLHVADEDEAILPRLRGRDPAVDAALAAMHAEHLAHQPKLAALFVVLDAVAASPRDPGLRADLARLAEALRNEFADHLRGEETVVFPALRRLLSLDEQAAIVRELRARRSAA